jgi:hypothetical protein
MCRVASDACHVREVLGFRALRDLRVFVACLRRRWKISAVSACAAFPLLLFVLAVPVVAHDLGRSDSQLNVQGSTVECQLTVDLLEFPGVDQDGNGMVSYAELDQSIAGIFDRIKEHFVVRGPSDPSRVVMTRHELLDEHTARLDLSYFFPSNVSRLEVTSTFDELARRPDYQHYVTTTMGGVEERAILDASRRTVTFEHRRWTQTSIWLTVALLLIGGRVGWFVFQRSRVRRRRGVRLQPD